MTVIIRGKLNRRNEWVGTQEIFRAPASLYTSSGSHYGSRLAFDGKGHLFYTIGDRGVFANAQDLANPLGKIHRVRDDGTVPADNPFVGRAGAVPTIWSYGHRNPQGLSWDPVSKLLWSSEHGPSGGDELNVIEKGKNYGWGLATMGIQPGITLRTAPGTEPPIVYYTPTIAPSGISFYSGKRYPGWKNNLFIAALAGQQLRRVEISGREVVAQEAVYEQFGRTRAVISGPDDLLYILLQNPTGAGTGVGLSASTPGMVIRLVPIGGKK
jgi:glucose/arabinose dehydrogenase